MCVWWITSHSERFLMADFGQVCDVIFLPCSDENNGRVDEGCGYRVRVPHGFLCFVVIRNSRQPVRFQAFHANNWGLSEKISRGRQLRVPCWFQLDFSPPPPSFLLYLGQCRSLQVLSYLQLRLVILLNIVTCIPNIDASMQSCVKIRQLTFWGEITYYFKPNLHFLLICRS